jgi:sensor histidine kinase YesM
MVLKEIAKLALGSLLVFFIISTVLSIFLTILSFIFTVMFTIAVIGSIMYALMYVKQGDFVESVQGQKNVGKKAESKEDRIERIKQQYKEGKISEEEFEKRLEVEFGGSKEEFIGRRTNRNKSREYF